MLIKVCHITSAHDSTDGRIFDKECVTLSNDDRFDVVLVAPGMCRTEKKVKVIGIGERPSSRFKRMFPTIPLFLLRIPLESKLNRKEY